MASRNDQLYTKYGDMRVRMLLVTGRTIVKLGVESMLADQLRIVITGTAGTEAEALEKLAASRPDLVLLDIQLPGSTGSHFIQRIKKDYPAIKVLILTIQDSESTLLNLLEAGADGYLLKDISQDELIFAIEKLEKDGSYMRPEFITTLLDRYKERAEATSLPAFNISEREMQVLKLISEGNTNINMAKKLFTSVRTIETRRKKLLDKTGTLNTATLIRFAVLNGLIN